MTSLMRPGGRASVFGIAPDPQPGHPDTTMPKHSTNDVTRRREQFLASWREYAPAANFAGLSLEQFETESRKPLDLRTRMTALRSQLRGLKLERDQADTAIAEIFTNVANAIRGNPDFGLNSPLYRSLGYVPKSERKRPARREKAAAPPAEADAA